MTKNAALQALLEAYREEIRWLEGKAAEYSANGGKSSVTAADYIHRARNLRAVIAGYERLDAKNPNLTQDVENRALSNLR